MPKILTTTLAVSVTAAALLAAVTPASAAPHAAPRSGQPNSSCRLSNGISHVVQLQFDNVHLNRDNPNIASDLEQMPNLFNFMKGNGVVLANSHDVLVHTATNFISSQTGLYPDRTSITQSNSFSYYDPAGATHTGVSFGYWTDPLYDPSGASIDTRYGLDYTADRNHVPNAADVNAPAPWVPYTRAGCNVGEVGMSNTVLENIATDIPTVFGAGSAQAAEAKANPAKATADVVGLAVHCSAGSTTCAGGQTDALPDEPGGYAGHQALFGNAEVQPAISPAGPVTAMSGKPIADPKGNLGFPGFDALTADNSLGYAATMLEHNVQIANVYLSDLHTDHSGGTGDFGPGEPGYEQQLADYDKSFGQFIARLAADGITPANTLFSISSDEGDHFSGSAPTPAGCTGQPGNYCSYTTRSEVNVNLPGLMATQAGNTTPFAIHSDPAPAMWLTGNPARTDAVTRQYGRDLAGLRITNPLTGANEKVAYQLADPVEEKILHFVGPDPARTPTLTAFSGEDSYVTGGAPNCTKACVFTSSGFAWNHGGIWPDMQTIFSALVGPGVSARGIDPSTWTDQTDARPTLLALAGLRDDYASDGRVLIEDLAPSALSPALRTNRPELLRLGQLYKQIAAADGQFAMDTLTASTKAVASGSATDDRTYTRLESVLTTLDNLRDRISAEISEALLGAAFGNRPVSKFQAGALSLQASALLGAAKLVGKI